MNAVVTVSFTLSQVTLPADTPPPAKIAVLLQQGGANQYAQQVTPDITSVKFPNVIPGSYVLVVEAIAADLGGSVVGTPYTAPLTVPTPAPVVYNVPSGASASFG